MHHTHTCIFTFLSVEVQASISPAYVSTECCLYRKCFDRISRGLGGLMCTLLRLDAQNRFLVLISTVKLFFVCEQTIPMITITL